MSKRTACFVICWLALAQLVSAADDSEKQVYSGPQPGEKLPPLTVEIAYGQRQQTNVDFVRLAGPKPAMGILGQPIKESLALSDTQLGLMAGLMFALFYATLGMPMAPGEPGQLRPHAPRDRRRTGARL